MASTSRKADAPQLRKNKRRSWDLSPENHDLVCMHATKVGISDNAALNALLHELREWRLGSRRFVAATT